MAIRNTAKSVDTTIVEGADTSFYTEGEETISAGSFVKVTEESVGAGETRKLTQIYGSCRFTGVWEARNGAAAFWKGRTGPGNSNVDVKLENHPPISGATTVSLWFCARDGAPGTEEAFGFLSGTTS